MRRRAAASSSSNHVGDLRRRTRRCGRTHRAPAAASSSALERIRRRAARRARRRSRPGRRRRRRTGGSSPRRAPSPGHRCRSARCSGRWRTDTGCTTTRSIGSMPYSAMSAWCSGLVGSASRPPWIFGCSVTTRWSRIAGTPVSSARSVTGVPGGGNRLGRAAAADHFPAELVQARGELDDAGLVVHGEQRSGHVSDSTRRRVFARSEHLTRCTVRVG